MATLSDGHAMTSTWCELHQSVYVDVHDSVMWYIRIKLYIFIVYKLQIFAYLHISVTTLSITIGLYSWYYFIYRNNNSACQ